MIRHFYQARFGIRDGFNDRDSHAYLPGGAAVSEWLPINLSCPWASKLNCSRTANTPLLILVSQAIRIFPCGAHARGKGGGGREGNICLVTSGGAGQHHVRAIFADSAILAIHFAIHLVFPVVCDRERFLVVCECRDSDQS